MIFIDGVTKRDDPFDTLYIGCEKFTQHVFYGIAVGGVRYFS